MGELGVREKSQPSKRREKNVLSHVKNSNAWEIGEKVCGGPVNGGLNNYFINLYIKT